MGDGAPADALRDAWRSRASDPEAWERARAAARQGPALRAGEIVGDLYQLAEHAGDGPLAATWAAVDLERDAPVAVVVLHGQHGADPEAVAAFREAAGSGAGGPHRPAVCDPGGTWFGFHWFALEGSPGRTLHRAVIDGGLGPAEALEAVVEAGRAVVDLHGQGRVHGLVSPDEIRIDDGGAAWLHGAGLVTPAAAAGVAWAAPERLDPSAPVTIATDVYGLALSMLFALHGGEFPFWAWRAPERLVDALEPPEPAASALRSAVHWDPDARPASAEALIAAVLDAPELRRSLAHACLVTDRPDEALDHLDALRSAAPDDPEILLLRAAVLDALDAPSELAWQTALEAHHTRDQARRALHALVERSEGEALVQRGLALLPLLPEADRPALQHRLGRVLLDELDDADRALPLLEAALEGGHRQRGLRRLVERLRTRRGDWVDVRRHAEQRGELRRAMDVARFAMRDDVRPLRQRLLEAEDDPGALRDEIRALLAEGGDALPLMARLAATGHATAADAVRHAEALVAAGRAEQAAEVRRSALDAHPTHLGLLEASAEDARRAGDLAGALALWDRVAEAIDGVGLHALEGRQEHARAELRWLLGDAAGAAALWHRRLDADPDDRAAWWGLARAAFAAPEDRPWIGATPEVFTPEEALARLLAGLLDPAAVRAWLGVPVPEDWSRCALMAAAVDRLLRDGAVGVPFFDDLADAFPEGVLAIEAVRWLWCEPGSELQFAVADTYRWSGEEERFDVRVTRRVMPLPAPFDGPTADVDGVLFRRGDGPIPIEAAWSGGTPNLAPERPMRFVVAGPGIEPCELRGDRVSVGGGPDDDLPLADLPAGRCAFVRAGETWYLLAEAPVRVDGEPVTERRVTDGTRIAVDGHNLRVHHLAAGAPIPGETDDVLLDLPENWPLGGPHAVLVHRRGKRETIIPFSGEVLALGRDPDDPVVPADGDFVYRLARTDGGYTLEDRTGSGMSELPPVLPLQHGDTFDIDDRTFTFRVKGVSETPSIPLTREERMAMVPLLVYDDPDGQQVVLPVLDDVFSVGRGGGNDLQLAGDPEISRHHCMLVRGTDGACILRDSGSANGTYVNGRLVERHILQVGDVIQIGDSTLEFRLGRREELEAELPDLVLEPVEETTSSRADTAAFRRPGR